MKLMLSAGEASGDLHGAALAHEMRLLSPNVELFGFGGEKMAQAGVRLVHNYRDYSVMGFWEVLKNLPRLWRLKRDLAAAMQREKPDALLLIDYPDFNWRLARVAKSLGIRVLSYIPPSAWAWRKGRAKRCAALAYALIAIFPFELPPYQRVGARIAFLGNPLLDTVHRTMSEAEARTFFQVRAEEALVLLLPGSREQEILRLLPVMLETAKILQWQRPQTRFFLPLAPSISRRMVHDMAKAAGISLTLTTECTYDLMGMADFALATSGTVVLEAALMNLPAVVLYRMSPLTYALGRLLVHVPAFSLPNILLQEKVEPELLQKEVTPTRIAQEALTLYRGETHREEMVRKLKAVRPLLGEVGATRRIAQQILTWTNEVTPSL